MKFYNLFLISMAVNFAACSQNEEPKIEETNDDDTTVTTVEVITKEDLARSLTSYSDLSLSEDEQIWAEGSVDFAWKLMAEHSAVNPGENTAISPLSASLALSMAEAGAAGETQCQMQDVLNYGDLSQPRVQSAIKRLSAELASRDEITKITLANSFWHQPSLPVKTAYKTTVKNYFQSDLYEINVSTFIKDANAWCADKTKNQIADFVRQGQSSSWTILNATYFKGIWSNGYSFNKNSTANKQFSNSNGTASNVKMMHMQKSYPYSQTDFSQAVAIPIGNGAYSMAFILPAKDCSLDMCLRKLADSGWRQAMPEHGSTQLIDLSIPKFEIESRGSLQTELKNMGLESAFSENADFSGISDIHTSFGDVLQGVKLSIDEDGAMAAAATQILGVGSTGEDLAKPISLCFNRPFIFCITERSTGCVLFAGKAEEL